MACRGLVSCRMRMAAHAAVPVFSRCRWSLHENAVTCHVSVEAGRFTTPAVKLVLSTLYIHVGKLEVSDKLPLQCTHVTRHCHDVLVLHPYLQFIIDAHIRSPSSLMLGEARMHACTLQSFAVITLQSFAVMHCIVSSDVGLHCIGKPRWSDTICNCDLAAVDMGLYLQKESLPHLAWVLSTGKHQLEQMCQKESLRTILSHVHLMHSARAKHGSQQLGWHTFGSLVRCSKSDRVLESASCWFQNSSQTEPAVFKFTE